MITMANLSVDLGQVGQQIVNALGDFGQRASSLVFGGIADAVQSAATGKLAFPTAALAFKPLSAPPAALPAPAATPPVASPPASSPPIVVPTVPPVLSMRRPAAGSNANAFFIESTAPLEPSTPQGPVIPGWMQGPASPIYEAPPPEPVAPPDLRELAGRQAATLGLGMEAQAVSDKRSQAAALRSRATLELTQSQDVSRPLQERQTLAVAAAADFAQADQLGFEVESVTAYGDFRFA